MVGVLSKLGGLLCGESLDDATGENTFFKSEQRGGLSWLSVFVFVSCALPLYGGWFARAQSEAMLVMDDNAHRLHYLLQLLALALAAWSLPSNVELLADMASGRALWFSALMLANVVLRASVWAELRVSRRAQDNARRYALVALGTELVPAAALTGAAAASAARAPLWLVATLWLLSWLGAQLVSLVIVARGALTTSNAIPWDVQFLLIRFGNSP
jgi:hypothetical protein